MKDFTYMLVSTSAENADQVAESLFQRWAGMEIFSDPMAFALLCIALVLTIVLVALGTLSQSVARSLFPQAFPEKEEEEVGESIISRLSDAVPVEEEESILMDHEYDGIQELDNNLPPWWKYGFYLTIVWSVVYLAHYHFFRTGDLSAAEYEKAVAEAQIEIDEYLALQADKVDESNVEYLSAAADLKKGRKIYEDKCVACHGNEGQGGIGPNLTDAYWKHGGSMNEVFATIKYGVTAKGMEAWGKKLSPKEINVVASYVRSIQGTNPPNPKEPEGELYKEEAPAEQSTAPAAE